MFLLIFVDFVSTSIDFSSIPVVPAVHPWAKSIPRSIPKVYPKVYPNSAGAWDGPKSGPRRCWKSAPAECLVMIGLCSAMSYLCHVLCLCHAYTTWHIYDIFMSSLFHIDVVIFMSHMGRWDTLGPKMQKLGVDICWYLLVLVDIGWYLLLCWHLLIYVHICMCFVNFSDMVVFGDFCFFCISWYV